VYSFFAQEARTSYIKIYSTINLGESSRLKKEREGTLSYYKTDEEKNILVSFEFVNNKSGSKCV